MDATEKRLAAAYDKALAKLRRTTKGTEESGRAALAAARAWKALQRYQQRHRN
jgi:hypothetical protein